jgi:hypothetical protein
MGIGIVEIITLLLGLTGFGAEANPKAPTPDVALQYAIPDADVVAHFDGAVVIPKNYEALTKLGDQPAIKASKELTDALKMVTGQLEGARGMVKSAVGLDFVTDIQDGTLFVQIPASGEPTFVAQVHGKFTTKMVETVGKLAGGKVTAVGSGQMMESGGNDPAFGVTKDGVMLVGTPSLVKARLDKWTMPARKAGSSLANAEALILTKPIFGLSVTLSATAKKRIQSEAEHELGKEKNFGTDLLARGKHFSFGVYSDGVGWTWTDKDKTGMESMALASEGIMDLMKAAQLAPRGVAKIAISALDSYKGKDKQVDALIKKKADLLKLVDLYTGDGNFKVAIDKNTKTNTVTARATGKTLSEVMPISSLMPVGAMMFFGMRSSSPISTPATSTPATVKPVKPVQPKKP